MKGGLQFVHAYIFEKVSHGWEKMRIVLSFNVLKAQVVTVSKQGKE